MILAAELAVEGVCGVEGRKEGRILVSFLITCLIGSKREPKFFDFLVFQLESPSCHSSEREFAKELGEEHRDQMCWAVGIEAA